MKRTTLVLIAILLCSLIVFSEDIQNTEANATDNIKTEFRTQLVEMVFYFVFGIIGLALSSLFGYLAVKFPKLAGYFYELKEISMKEVERTEQKRKELIPDALTAKQGIQLKTETAQRIIQTRPAQELRRGVANIFGIFGGRAKELGKNLFDNAVPGIIDEQVSKLKSKI